MHILFCREFSLLCLRFYGTLRNVGGDGGVIKYEIWKCSIFHQMHTHAFNMALWTIWDVFFCGCEVFFVSNAKICIKSNHFPFAHKLQNVGILFSLTHIRSSVTPPQHHPSETEHKRSIFNAVSTTCSSALSSKALLDSNSNWEVVFFHKLQSFFIVHPDMIPKTIWFDSRLQMKHISFYTKRMPALLHKLH